MRCPRCDNAELDADRYCAFSGHVVSRAELMVALPVTDVRVVRWERDRADFAWREAS